MFPAPLAAGLYSPPFSAGLRWWPGPPAVLCIPGDLAAGGAVEAAGPIVGAARVAGAAAKVRPVESGIAETGRAAVAAVPARLDGLLVGLGKPPEPLGLRGMAGLANDNG